VETLMILVKLWSRNTKPRFLILAYGAVSERSKKKTEFIKCVKKMAITQILTTFFSF